MGPAHSSQEPRTCRDVPAVSTRRRRGNVLVPDLAGWRRTRLPQVSDALLFTLAPDCVCDVLSPSTPKLDLGRKLPRYALAGIGHAWIIDPVHRALEVFRLKRRQWVLVTTFSGDDRVRAEPVATNSSPAAPLCSMA
ncbi:MAG: Uma2 family endonuclease [Myxococcaceae bacterium]